MLSHPTTVTFLGELQKCGCSCGDGGGKNFDECEYSDAGDKHDNVVQIPDEEVQEGPGVSIPMNLGIDSVLVQVPTNSKETHHYAQEADLRWMNFMIRQMWPHGKAAMIKKLAVMLPEKVHEEFDKHKGVSLNHLEVDFDPGNVPPRVTGIQVYVTSQQERQGIQVDVDFEWVPDSSFHFRMNIKGKAAKIPLRADQVGVAGMEVRGIGSVLLSPLLDSIPCFGAGSAFFLDIPQVKLRPTKLKKLGAIGRLLASVMSGAVQTTLEESFVLPNRLMHQVRQDLPLETLVSCKSPLPIGMLELQVMEAKDLPASDVSLIGKASSDPFVQIKVGRRTIKTSTISNNCNPVWHDHFGQLFVYNAAQLIRIAVYDDDMMGDDLLGVIPGYNVFLFCQACEGKEEGEWFTLKDPHDPNKNVGQIRIRLRYWDMLELGELPPPPLSPNLASPAPTPRTPTGLATEPPYVLTVKLLGLETEDRSNFGDTRAMVKLHHPLSKRANAEEGKKTATSRMFHGLMHAAEKTKGKLQSATGLGFSEADLGMHMSKRSGKAVNWHQPPTKKGSDESIPPMAVSAMERMHMMEGMSVEKIAQVFDVEPDAVATAVSVRSNFTVVWREAIHFIQPPEDPYRGSIRVEVKAPVYAKVANADDSGYIGACELVLASALEQGAGKYWSRRVRRPLMRVFKKKDREAEEDHEDGEGRRRSASSSVADGSKTADAPAGQDDTEEGKKGMLRGAKDLAAGAKDTLSAHTGTGKKEKDELEDTGVLIEFLVEIRQMKHDKCEMEPGQVLRDKEQLIASTTTAGVDVIPE